MNQPPISMKYIKSHCGAKVCQTICLAVISLILGLRILGDIVPGQKLQLQPGWNAVWLEVQPFDSTPGALFDVAGIESVWNYNRSPVRVQFVDDPNSLLPSNPDWLVYFPIGTPLAALSTLHSIESGHAFLIKVATNSAPLDLKIAGQPVPVKHSWISDSLNFTGFSVGENPPTFGNFFAASPAHTNQLVFRLQADGSWNSVDASTTKMKSGEAFWINTRGSSTFAGPVEVRLSSGGALNFGRSLVENDFHVRNNGNLPVAFVLSKRDLSPTNAAADLRLNYWILDQSNNIAGWFPLSNSITSPKLQPGAEWLVRLEVRRREMSTNAVTLHGAVLDVADDTGAIRVTFAASAETAPLAGSKKDVVPNKYAGLWVGGASIDKVSQPSSDQPLVPTAAAGQFLFRLLVHVDNDGKARLLQKALVMWDPGVSAANSDGRQVVQTPGRYVIVTDYSLLSHFQGSVLRDGQAVSRRYSTTGFVLRTNLLMTGTFGGDSLNATVLLDYNDPLNPFKHRYHPDHDNLDENTPQNLLPNGQESFDIARSISLQFTDTDPDGLAVAGWGDNQMGGHYLETINGLHKQPIVMSGTFRLQQASRVGLLNDGL